MTRTNPTSDIRGFFGDHRWLSNFAIEHDGLTVEHRFQAAKAEYTDQFKWVMASSSPGEAKRRGRKIEMRSDWETVKLDVMLNELRRKFSVSPFRWLLIATDGRELVEVNDWGDTFWGVDERTGRGTNHLGRLLMQVRDELIAEDARAD